MQRPSDAQELDSFLQPAKEAIETCLADFDLPFDMPELHLLAVFWPPAVELHDAHDTRADSEWVDAYRDEDRRTRPE